MDANGRKILAKLAAGEIDLIVGTHALFQEDVAFHDLALAIVDEQHRFGVHQRLALARKGEAVDLLVLTATPIPRTLVLTYFGDMDVSELREKPAGRQPIDTRALPLDRLSEVIDAVARALDDGRRVYWVCPLVEESETTDLAAAEERFKALKKRFGDTVELVHGQMRAADKDRAMARFAEGTARILVATTVIEVGVDVPEASVMVIEHAERFGLAQLHQLRGRVGRGSERSICLLLYKGPLGDTAKARLAILRETNDGFRIAEEDLRLRGEGDVLGTRQSGCPASASPGSKCTASFLAPHAKTQAWCSTATRRSAHRAARRCGSCFICSRVTKRSGCSAPGDERHRLNRPSPLLAHILDRLTKQPRRGITYGLPGVQG